MDSISSYAMANNESNLEKNQPYERNKDAQQIAHERLNDLLEPATLLGGSLLEHGIRKAGGSVITQFGEKVGSTTIQNLGQGVASGKSVKELADGASKDAVDEVTSKATTAIDKATGGLASKVSGVKSSLEEQKSKVASALKQNAESSKAQLLDAGTGKSITKQIPKNPVFDQVLDENGKPMQEEGDRIANQLESQQEWESRMKAESGGAKNIVMQGADPLRGPKPITQAAHEQQMEQARPKPVSQPAQEMDNMAAVENKVHPSMQTGGIDPSTLPEDSGFNSGLKISANKPEAPAPDATPAQAVAPPQPQSKITPDDLAPTSGGSATKDSSIVFNNPAFDPNVPDGEKSFDDAISGANADEAAVKAAAPKVADNVIGDGIGAMRTLKQNTRERNWKNQ